LPAPLSIGSGQKEHVRLSALIKVLPHVKTDLFNFSSTRWLSATSSIPRGKERQKSQIDESDKLFITVHILEKEALIDKSSRKRARREHPEFLHEVQSIGVSTARLLDMCGNHG
jgi:hypothetical protein